MNTLSRLSLIFLISSSALSYGENQPKILAIQQAEIAQIKNSLVPLGAITYSIVSEEDFRKINGSSWVLMKGQEIQSSRLCQLAKICRLPNATGRFLRIAGGASEPTLGGLQGQSTAKNGLAASTSLTSNLNVSISGIRTRSDNSGACCAEMRLTANDRPGGYDYAANGVLMSLEGIATGGAWSTALQGDAETRPENMTVNAFIKID
jgi:hypothetical protein